MFVPLVLIMCRGASSKAEPPVIPKEKTISYISITHSKTPEKTVLIKDKKDIAYLVSTIRNGAKKTKKESVNDLPVNSAEYYTFGFHSGNDGNSSPGVIYFYTDNGKHYIEAPYSGIWKLSGKNYRNCISFYK
ncbi:MAG: DUF5301 domain-containing protein [Eubacterium sp.]|nr:DUF5301 domain-containing protein [Eubacterium sp.]